MNLTTEEHSAIVGRNVLILNKRNMKETRYIMKYSIKTTRIDNGDRIWDSTKVDIFEDEKFIGSYIRNYPSGIFFPFLYKDKWFALFSENYECVSVMSLPDCKKITETEEGFCPVDVWVPAYKFEENSFKIKDKIYPCYYAENVISKDENQSDCEKLPLLYHDFAFVSGCVWGDDSRMKVRLLDLKNLDQGEIKYLNIGYLEILNSIALNKAINIDSDDGKNFTFEVSVVKDLSFQRETSKIKIYEEEIGKWKDIQ